MGCLDDPGGSERFGLVGLEAEDGRVGVGEQSLGAGERRAAILPLEIGRQDADERGLAGELDRGEQLVPRGEESEHLPLVEPLVGDGARELVGRDGVHGLLGVVRSRPERLDRTLRRLLGESGDGLADLGQDHRRPAFGDLADLPDLGRDLVLPGGTGSSPQELLFAVRAPRSSWERRPFVSQTAPQNTSSPARNAATTWTPRRRTNGTGTGTGPRLGARTVCLALVRPLPLIAICTVSYRFSKRLTMIAPS